MLFRSYRIKHYDSVVYECGSLSNEDESDNLKEWIDKECNDVEYFSISRFVNGEIVVEESRNLL